MLLGFREKIKQSEFIKSVFSVGSGNLLAQIIQIITVPLVSRIFTDAEHGQFSLIVSSASLITTFCTLGLTSAIMVPKKDDESNQILLTAFVASNIIAGIFCIALLIISSWWRLFEIDMSYMIAVILMFLHIILTTLSSILYTSVNRSKLNKVLMFNPIIGAGATLFVTIPLGLMGFGAISFILASIISQLIIIIHMLRHINPFKTKFSFKIGINIIKKYKPFVIYQCPANMISGFAGQAPTQMLGRCFSSGMLGNYAMCMKLMEYPSRLIAAPINTVYFRTANQYVLDGKDLSTFTYKLIKNILLVALGPIVLTILFAKPIFVFFLGKQWAEAGAIASLLVFPLVLKFCSTCTSYCRVALDKQQYNLVFCCINFIISLASLLLGFIFTHDFMLTILIYAIFFSIIGIMDLGLNFYCLEMHFKKYVKWISLYSLLIGIAVCLKFYMYV